MELVASSDGGSASDGWKLGLIARCEAFAACLSDAGHERLQCALARRSLHAMASEDGSQLKHVAGDLHLERYKKWKLDDAKIEELTAVRAEATDEPTAGIASPVEAVSALVNDLEFFARGKRGVLYSGVLRRDHAASVVVKFAGDPRASTCAVVGRHNCWIEAEARWIRQLNRLGIGAKLETSGRGWLVCERLVGLNIVEFLSTVATYATARWVLREVLCQCFTLDMMGINKEEMTHPTRHIIVHLERRRSDDKDPQHRQRHPRRWKCTFIDFEKCTRTKKPKNVTQICQFLSSPRMTSLFQAQGVTWDVSRLRQQTKRYKQRVSVEAFGAILGVFGL